MLSGAFIRDYPRESNEPCRHSDDSKALRNWDGQSAEVVQDDGREIPFAICAVDEDERADGVEVPLASTAVCVVSDSFSNGSPVLLGSSGIQMGYTNCMLSLT